MKHACTLRSADRDESQPVLLRLYGSRSPRRGSITALALLTVGFVFMLSMAFLMFSQATTRRQAHSTDTKNAFYLAEAGLAEAYAGLAIGKTGNVGTPNRPAAIGNGVFWVEATDLGGGVTQLECTALHGRGRASLGLVAERVPVSVVDLGFFVSDSVQINPDTLIDSFDSSQGSYGEQAAAGINNDEAVLGSNGDIRLSSGDILRGDLIPGVGGTANVAAGATVTGSIQTRAAPGTLPPVDVPDIPLGPAVVVSDPAAPLVIPPGQHGFESFSLNGTTSAVFTGPATIVMNDLSAKRDSLLTLDTSGGPIDIYLKGSLDLNSGSSVVVANSKPNELTVQVASSETVNLGATSHFYGMLYAPNSRVQVSAQFETYGSLIAKDLSLAAMGRMHMDLNRELSRDDVLPGMWSWRVVDIPDAVASKGSDRLGLLGIDRSQLAPPAQSHQDQWLFVTYLDLNGDTRTYDGMESDFDWALVTEVLTGSRDGMAFRAVPPPDERAPAPPSEPEAPAEPLSAEEQALVDLINSPLSSRDLKRELINNTPLTDPVLLATIQREPAMDHPDLKAVLLRNNPLSEPILLATIDEPDFVNGSLVYILIDNSPLTATELEAALTKDPPLSATQMNEVLAAQ